MYKVKIIKSFSSAHYLPNYRGSCETLHGHNWKVEVLVSAQELNSSAMVIDFRKLKEITSSVIGRLDHRCLNDLDFFQNNSPSSEVIARYIFDEIKKKLPANRQLDAIWVWENENSAAVYSDNENIQ